MTPQLYAILTGMQSFLKRHHPIVFIALIGLLLAAAVFSLYHILSLTAADASATNSSIGSFDQKTVDKIKKLNISSDSNQDELTFPSPRANPFVED